MHRTVLHSGRPQRIPPLRNNRDTAMPADWLDKANPRALYDRINVPPFYFPRIAGPAAYRAGQSTIIGASKAKSPAGFYQQFIGYLFR